MRRSEHVDDVAIFAFWGLQGGVWSTDLDGEEFTIFPPMFDMWGNDVIDLHVEQFDANAVITLLDIWVLKEEYGNGFCWLPYMPIDTITIPETFKSRLRKAYLPIVYSQHADMLLQDEHIEHVYAPHGVDTSVYHPIDMEGRIAAKKRLGFEGDEFVVGMVAANKAWPSRKGFPEAMDAFAQLHASRPDARLYIHSVASKALGGPDLAQMAKSYGIEKVVRFTQDYYAFIGLAEKDMATLYNAFDVFLLPSMGEGFGIPLIEAQACGVPVITTDATAMSELCGSGWKIPISHEVWVPTGSWQVLPDVSKIVEALFEAYEFWGDETLRTKARDFALQYDWDRVWNEYWVPILARLNAELTPRRYKRSS